MNKFFFLLLMGLFNLPHVLALVPPLSDFIPTWNRGSNIKDLIAIDQGMEDYALKFGDAVFELWIHAKADLNDDGKVTLAEVAQFDDTLDLFPLVNIFGGQSVREISGLHFFWNINNLIIWNAFDLETLPPTLSSMKRLEQIYFTHTKLKELPDLTGLTQLDSLQVVFAELSKLSSFSTLTSLRSIQLNNNLLTDIPDLHQLPGGIMLNVGHNPIETITPAFLPPMLGSLGLSSTSLTKLPSLRQYVHLNSLRCMATPLEFIQSLPASIRNLQIGWNQLKELPSLTHLTQLDTLDVRSNQLTELPDFSGLVNLEVLLAQGNQLTQLPDLSSCISLNSIYAYDNQLTEISDISSCPVLRGLIVGYNHLTELPDLSQTQLYLLDCQGNQLTELPDLSHMVDLWGLYVDENKIPEIPNLEIMQNLQGLGISHNPISYLPSMERLTILRVFDASYCELKILPELNQFSQMEWLNIAGNKLDWLPNISNLQNMWYLDISNNRLQSLPLVYQNSYLSYFYCQGNYLSDYSCDTIKRIQKDLEPDEFIYNPQGAGVICD